MLQERFLYEWVLVRLLHEGVSLRVFSNLKRTHE
jgi:hypothetical protein